MDRTGVWTRQHLGKASCSGQHIQYSPFTCQQPYIGSFDQDDELQLPPMVLAVYLESETSPSFVWKPVLRLFFDYEDDGSYLEMITDLSSNSFSCDCDDPVTVRDGVLKLGANTEYIMDNVLLHVTKHLFLEGPHQKKFQPPSDCFLFNVDASLVPLSTLEAFSETRGSVSWGLSFALALGRDSPSHTREKSVRSQKRHYANLVSHKMCSPMSFSRHVSQRYHSNMLSVSFETSAGKMSMTFLSASVSHDRHQRAVAEFLVWFEKDGACDEVIVFGNCVSAAVSFVDLSCSAHGIRVPAHIETHTFLELDRHPRERVVTCTFNSSSFSHNDDAVDVIFDDSSMNLRAVVPMCTLPRERPIRKIVACSQPIYNAGFLEARWPGVLQAWVLYHVGRPPSEHDCSHGMHNSNTQLGQAYGLRSLFFI